ncbi:carbohydrate ABC transporter permease [Paenibacillus sp. PAMC21692]|uniref:carbohydrate ABC transporter permease n=1 Tax=Paenibacillus sp. PAMC21692 TaxID=2762320 RepID=UPI00164ECA0B|nr:carbohydrate ABC transporter permease [Paenibacillus sp. PAMC21692]QNK55925.1 carbohydrate ABC transporter permease [Paenibacillus sp. PAMC21692]
MKRYLRIIITLFVACLFFMPFYIAIVNMFKPLNEIKSNPMSLPFPFVWDNFISVLTKPGSTLLSSLWNSTVITSISVLLIVISSSMVSYYIARENTRFSNGLMIFLLFGLMIPPQIVLIPIVKVLQFFGIMHSMTGVIVFFIAYYVPFATFLYSGFTKTVPRELDEAAAIDGAGQIRIFWTIIFPLLAPVTASVLIFQSVFIWNDFLNPLIIMGPMRGTTITTGIYQAMGQFSTNWGEMFVLMFLASAPILVFYLFLQKHFIDGLTAGSIKG